MTDGSHRRQETMLSQSIILSTKYSILVLRSTSHQPTLARRAANRAQLVVQEDHVSRSPGLPTSRNFARKMP